VYPVPQSVASIPERLEVLQDELTELH